jgi:hypothetical protein
MDCPRATPRTEAPRTAPPGIAARIETTDIFSKYSLHGS